MGSIHRINVGRLNRRDARRLGEMILVGSSYKPGRSCPNIGSEHSWTLAPSHSYFKCEVCHATKKLSGAGDKARLAKRGEERENRYEKAWRVAIESFCQAKQKGSSPSL